ncbi:ATP-binding cassette domain-containing protein [Paracoccus sp. 1_MG-2023]|uniref:ATP-binding cassette domain-containing protein n=1 Tax=unclassified Paracoccus (in: a-proteobacteria) TaxID=2688777 RepID=UPI001C0A1AE2|nr:MULTISPECIES: ATP-binding cassette domain-containing protein [unclassified Paracoccus (in: a-proteobacteria)]MBU2956087.1 ATP-binding cassette domain-containing protein [Paracoccus sp. C2R09]MDO6669493.1 ATP-binding cassette domain-containing protein [Paracoccus sp. 1_MG-2023]
MLELNDLAVTLPDGTHLFDPLSLRVPKGCVTTVMGPSGVGKSTLLDAIGGQLAPGFGMAGRIVLDGRDVTRERPEKRNIGIIFQKSALFPHLSVGQNLGFGMPRRHRDRRSRIEAALTDAGLAGMADRDPATLSGGQTARAALMRGLLAEPAAILLDEPFSALDATLRDEIRGFTFAHLRNAGIPALMVTHDDQDARAAGGPVVALNAKGRP